MVAKLFIVLFILAILFSLGSALYYLLHDHGDSTRMVKALSYRIGLSLLLFVLLMVGFATGVLKPHNIALYQPVNQAQPQH